MYLSVSFGLPGCVMSAKRTVFDLVLPRLAAGDEIHLKGKSRLHHKEHEAVLCLNCKVCTFPDLWVWQMIRFRTQVYELTSCKIAEGKELQALLFLTDRAWQRSRLQGNQVLLEEICRQQPDLVLRAGDDGA